MGVSFLLAARPQHDARGPCRRARCRQQGVPGQAQLRPWLVSGGGVEVGESFIESLRRELEEEGRIELKGEPVLHGIFHNSHVSPRDHVAVYVVRNYRQDRLPEPNREIVACGFFDPADLPDETTPGTRLRIAEVLEGRPPTATWR